MNRACWPLVSLVLLVACNQSDFDELDPNEPTPDGPGTPQWGDVDVSCSKKSDCNYGETCVSGVCQMERCGKDYESGAPLGARRALLSDRELVVVDGSTTNGAYWARGYSPSGTSMTATGSAVWNTGGTAITDVAGGTFLESGPELVVVARDGSSSLYLPKINETLNAGFVPVAVTAGDVDHDGMDEAIALGAVGQIAICDVDTKACKRYDFPADTEGYEIASGDVDADGIDEVVFHLERAGTNVITVWNLDAATTGQPAAYQVASGYYMGLAVADMNGDTRAEIYALEDGGWLGYAYDSIVTFTSNGSAVAKGTSLSVTTSAADLAGGDLDHDRKGDLVLLSTDKIARVYRGPNLTLAYQSTLSTASSPERITAVDFDGDSTMGRLMAGPELVPGEVVPTTVLYMPPYYEGVSTGRPTVFMGNTSISGDERSDSVGLSVGATIGYGFEVPLLLEAEISVEMEMESTHSKTFSKEIRVGNRFSVEADPTLYGTDNAAVALSCGCYHQYTYRVESPNGTLGEEMVVLIPVGGQTMLWSTKRYNEMAKKVGNLPIIPVPTRVGDAKSYPKIPQRADGTPIPAADLVFTSAPSIRVSDVGEVEWSLLAEETQSNGVAMSTSVGVSASVTVGGFMVGGSAGMSWEQGYEVLVGTELELGGAVPPIADNPNTPEDEYEAYAYGFQPSVYRQYYTTKDGSKTAYYVVDYAVDF